MPKARVVLHPILLNKRSRVIFLWYLLLAFGVGIYSWIKFESVLRQADIQLLTVLPQLHWMVGLMSSWYVRVALIFVSAVLAGAISAPYVVGPVKRLEEWLHDWEQNQPLKPLKLRDGDKFSKLVDLINQLRNKDSSKS
jgi:hypothetical protein